MSDVVLVERDGPTARVKLNRPDRRNALSGEVWEALYATGQDLTADNSVRVVLLTGEGKAFCSGLDLASFAGGLLSDLGVAASTIDDGASPADPVAGIMRMQDAFSWLESGDFVSIAAVHGYALGAGWRLALACDFTIAAEGTMFGLLETNYGLVPDMGGTVRLARSVGISKAKQLILTGKKIDAEEAHAIGAVAEVAGAGDLETAAAAAAGEVLRRSPTAMRLAKDLIAKSASRKVSKALRAEARAQVEAIGSADFREAIGAFMQKREPDFQAVTE